MPSSGFAATFLWSPSATTRAVDVIAPYSSLTDAAEYFGPVPEWADIENLSGGWQFGVDAATGNNVIAFPVSSTDSFAYDSDSAFALSGGAGPGEVINIYAIAWDTEGGLYDTLASAEAADAPVGWSSVFQYTLGSSLPATPPAETVIPSFDIDGMPEPTTLALAGLGAFSILFVRRSRGDETQTKL